jgi:hypothetical protein
MINSVNAAQATSVLNLMGVLAMIAVRYSPGMKKPLRQRNSCKTDESTTKWQPLNEDPTKRESDSAQPCDASLMS